MLTHIGQYLSKLRRHLSRSEHAINWFKLERKVNPKHPPGVLMIQIDGLSRKQMQEAMSKGRLPFLNRLIQKEHYETGTFYSGIPSSTPAVQAELFYGQSTAVPAFYFQHKATGNDFKMSQSESAITIEKELQKKHGPGLLTGGSSYSNVYSGGAEESHFCSTDLQWNTFFNKAHRAKTLLFLMLQCPTLLRIVFLGCVEISLALIDFIRGTFARESWKAEFAFLPLRLFICIILREWLTLRAKIDLARGLPIIHLNFLGYDEQAHRRGPSSAFAHWTLKGIDAAIKRLFHASQRSAQRHYSVIIYSDHGQEQVKSFQHHYGQNFETWLQSLYNKNERSPSSESPKEPKQGTFLGHSAKHHTTTNSKEHASKAKLSVHAMGPLALISFTESLSFTQKIAFIKRTLQCSPVKLALILSPEDTVLAITPEKTFPLRNNLQEALGYSPEWKHWLCEDLESLCRHPDSGEVIFCGWQPQGKAWSFPLENGAHAGPGSEETQGFFLLPHDIFLQAHSPQYLRPRQLRKIALTSLSPQPLKPIISNVIAASSENRKFKLNAMTYNIHHGRGLDGRVNLYRILRLIRQCKADIIALQEVDCGRVRSFSANQAKWIAEQLQYDFSYYPLIHSKRQGTSGLAIISRFTLTEESKEQLPTLDRDEDRGFLWLSFLFHEQRIHIVNTHLGVQASARNQQAETLFNHDCLNQLPPNTPLIIAGDFNATARSPVYSQATTTLIDVQTEIEAHTPQNTFCSKLAVARIDHLFVSPQWKVTQLQVPKNYLARIASDHLPVCAELVLDMESS